MTLKKLNVAELRLGMYLHGFDGSWLQHPFWKSKFLLKDANDLRAAHNSGVQTCWIDTARGLDVEADAPPAPTPSPEPEAAAPVPVLAPEPAKFDQELQRAAALCLNARDATASMFNEARLGNAIDTLACLPLVNDISDSVLRNREALISLARLKSSDDYTYMHSVAVCALMVALAQALGLDEAACRDAGMAGLLHDIGKAHMPLDILNKPGKLTDDEFATIRRHPERGHDLLLSGGTASAAMLDVCLHHHEKIDGSGYPHRLEGDQISLLARMGAVCDVYDAITSNRPYKAGWDPAESVARMISWKGHFDNKILSAFIKILGIYPTGALVKMRSGRLAVVIEQNPATMTRPVVKVFFSTTANAHIAVERIDLARPDENDVIVGREPRGRWDAALIDEMWAGDLASRGIW
ncbi:HD-GYP domain-containing protein [Massilia sp. DWR3-1-1]|uniref:HD-GYP domain-containing protein n=1 Tax=Massilia sp. DWR3-1-1 TaxID=2804559 RepID=UPI003CF1DB1E